MIKIRCRTNLDLYQKEQWPVGICCRPMVGDIVESRSGKRLQICSITHKWVAAALAILDCSTGCPILEIELNKRSTGVESHV
ncbi:hypothetical protein LCGC14_2335690 [marine sediment metagenome]|uniref:Uncharacterized protein n=1 Tax=marine sediment metagenome TaxID=412755 RepID=A0A0F9D106_9ZZZZ